MRQRIVSCDAAAPLAEVVATMCAHRVHAVVVERDGRRSGLVSDADVIAAAERGENCPAGEMASAECVAISAGRSLQEAARLMVERGVAHLLVRDATNGHVRGVISTTDIMCAMGIAT